VRLLRLHAIRFGPIRERLLDLDDEIVIVFGRNESGKSTFRSAIETIVYGFDPATRDKHPLHGWDGGAGGDLQLEALLRLEAGELQRVERVLQSTGKLRIASGSEEFHGAREGNRPLPWSSLPREVFQAIHSLELDDLSHLDQRVQGHVDDLLLPESPGLELRAASEVRRALSEEAQRLWRSDGRGRPLARELRERLADARLRASEAGTAEQALRRTREELHALEAELETRRMRKRELERARDEAPRIAALRELLLRKHAQGAPLDLAPLGGRPLLDPSELVRELAELEEGRRAHVERLRRAELALEPGETLLLARASEIEAAAARAGRDAADAERAADFERRERALREEAERELARVVEAPVDDGARAAARAAPLEALRGAQAGWARAFEEHVERAGARGARAPGWVIALAAVGALALLAALLLGDAPMLAAVGAASLLIAIVMLLRGPGARPTAPGAPEGLDSLLAGLDVPRERRSSHAALAQVVDALDRARRAGDEAERCAAEARRLADAVAQGERSARELCADVGIESEGAPEARAARLRDALRAARIRERDALQDRAERARARESLDATEPALRSRLAHRDALLGFLEAAEPGAGTAQERYERVRRRQGEREFVRQREAELLADPVCARLAGDPRVRADVPGDEPGRDAAAILDALRECDDAISSARERVGRLRQRLVDDPGGQRAAAQDEVADLEERLAETLRLRDRLALQESLVARAESTFRDEHQPDVLRRASDYLRRVTDGRYTRLDYDPEARALSVTCSDRAEPLAVRHPISRGTRDQIFLCLRLGLLDHLDEDRERLPLVLDDALLRMDDVRRAEVYRLLADAARRRQVFLLTCHAQVAREAEEAMKVRRIDLSA
jgi:uncharacterized protein YhaN